MSEVLVYPTPTAATEATADWLVERLHDPSTRNIMVAGGNTPLALYASVAERLHKKGSELFLAAPSKELITKGKNSSDPFLREVARLNVFALDEYVGVPPSEPRNCANLIKKTVVEAWSIPAVNYSFPSSLESEAEASVVEQEKRIEAVGGLDLVILGLGKNGHIGFNEPGSAADAPGRVLALDEISVEANRQWFEGDYAPSLGVTTGMKTLLAARSILLLAFGTLKAPAVAAMLEGPRDPACPASLLQQHFNVHYVLDVAAAHELRNQP